MIFVICVLRWAPSRRTQGSKNGCVVKNQKKNARGFHILVSCVPDHYTNTRIYLPTLSHTRQTSWTKNNSIKGEEAKTFVNVSTILNADVDVCVTTMVDGRSNSMQNAHVTLSGRLDPFLLKRKWGLKEKRFLLCLCQINRDKSVNYIERFLNQKKINEELYHFIFCPPFELLGIYLDVVHWRCPFFEKLPQVWHSGIALMDLLTRIVNQVKSKSEFNTYWHFVCAVINIFKILTCI